MNKACVKGAEQLQKSYTLQAATEVTTTDIIHTSLKISITWFN